MNKHSIQLLTRHYLLGLGAVAFLGILAPSVSSAAETASATISATSLGGGENQYTLTLNDTGTTTVGTFWFAWVPGDNFMPATPTAITSPAGWQETVTSGGPSGGSAIQWKASSAASDVNAGGTLAGFSFESTLTLAQLQAASTGTPADPVDTTFIYSGAPFSDNGYQLTPTVVTGPGSGPTPTPEPRATGLAGIGLCLLTLGVRKFRSSRVRA
ncbi:MAG: hypothetical protein JO061_08835 [Acidobacteriaceae bacterium]|nr:hypothetical protein [Acidobacteriaceae bacterium]